jgi:hypothetical protein
MGVPAGPGGQDTHLVANHLGPYLLTRLLLPAMKAGSRVVNVSSRAHYQGSLTIQEGQIVEQPSSWYVCQPADGVPADGVPAASSCMHLCRCWFVQDLCMLPCVQDLCMLPCVQDLCMLPCVQDLCMLPCVQDLCMLPCVQDMCMLPCVQDLCMLPRVLSSCSLQE